MHKYHFGPQSFISTFVPSIDTNLDAKSNMIPILVLKDQIQDQMIPNNAKDEQEMAYILP